MKLPTPAERQDAEQDDEGFLDGGGELTELIAGFDWGATPLGPINRWPQSLRTTVTLILRSPVPIVTLWGQDGIMIYNDAYSGSAGGRHPGLLGSRVREGWGRSPGDPGRVASFTSDGGTAQPPDGRYRPTKLLRAELPPLA